MHSSGTAHNTLTRLTRLAQRRPRAQAWLERAFDKYLGRLAAPALEVSAETGDPVGFIFAQVLRTGGDDDLLGELAEQLDAGPYTNAVTLREIGLVVVERNIEMRRRWWPEPTLAQRHDLAQLEITRALRLEEVVGLEEGIASV